MVGFSSISPFSHLLEFGTIHMMDQDTVIFMIITNTDISTHDSFHWYCSHAKPYDDELDIDAYWPYLKSPF